MSTLVVLGTRPEIVKLGPVVREMARRRLPSSVLHTGQHFDADMSDTFLDTFGIEVTTQLHLGDRPRAAQIGRMTDEIGAHLAGSEHHTVVVQGDTNSALAGALAANATGRRLVHVEAGLRSFDRRMPEEHNRVLVDAIADACGAPTSVAAANLHAMGVDPARVRVTGNTVMDAIAHILDTAGDEDLLDRDDLGTAGLGHHGFVLATIHRPENTDDPDRLRGIVGALGECALPVVLPLHPRTRAALDRAGIDPAALPALRPVEPLDYARFLGLLGLAAFAVSDSGGIQEEVTATGTPLVVVRDSTERPEVLDTFARRVGGGDAAGLTALLEGLVAGHDERRRLLRSEPSPYAGPEGRSPSAHVVDLIESPNPGD